MRLQALGGLGLEGTVFRRAKPLLFLCFLSLEGPRARRELAELFWPRAKDPRDSLSTAISQLRNRFPGIVAADRERVRTTIGCDAAELLALVDAGRFEAAVEAYRGPFLEGLSLSLGEELEEWVFVTREVVAARVQEALLQLGEQDATRGRLRAAARRAEAAYLLRGVPERSLEDLRRLYALLSAAGSPQVARVRSDAEAFGIALRSDAEIPGLDAPAEAVGEVRCNLPVRRTSFVGRDPERVQIAGLLAGSACRLLTIHGQGGIGKSRLALQAVRDLLNGGQFDEGGIFLVPLDALATSELLPGRIAEALGLVIRGRDDPLERVLSFIGDRATLLVLDNFEHLMAASSLPTALLDACPRLKILVTSRERLDVEGEWVLTLEGLPVPPEDTTSIEEAGGYDAVRLFLDRARRASLAFGPTDGDLPAVLRICRLVGGSPLGIELAAAWVRALSLEEIAGAVAENPGFPTSTSRDVPERHRSIRAALEHSWKLLGSREKTVLRRLAVFSGGFRKEAAGDVAAATLASLVTLVDRSLLEVSTGGRYRLHPLTHRFCQEKLAEHPDELEAARERHGRYYLRLVEALQKRLGTEGHREAQAAFEEDLDNVRSAWRWAVAGERVQELGQVAGALSEMIQRHGLEAAGMFAGAAAALDDAKAPQRLALGRILVAQADRLYGLGRDEQATRQAERGLALLRPLNDAPGVARGLFRLGQLARRGGDLDGAEANFREGSALATKHRLPRLGGWFSALLARVAIERGYSARTERYCREVLAQLRAFGYLDILAAHLSNFGWLYLFHEVDRQAARPLFTEGLRLARACRLPMLMPPLLDGLARSARDEGDFVLARDYLLEGLGICRRHHDTYAEVFLSLTLATVETASGDYARARGLLLRCLRTAWDQRHDKLLFRNLTLLADLDARRGRLERALVWLSLVRRHPDAPQRDKVAAGRLLEKLGDRVSTRTYADAVERTESLELAEVVTAILSPGGSEPHGLGTAPFRSG